MVHKNLTQSSNKNSLFQQGQEILGFCLSIFDLKLSILYVDSLKDNTELVSCKEKFVN